MEPSSNKVQRIEIPIPIKALKTVNAYLLTSQRESLLIDTGMGLEPLNKYLNRNIDKAIITHLHIDHIGGVTDIIRETGAEVYIHESDWRRIETLMNDPIRSLKNIKRLFLENGTPSKLIEEMLNLHPGYSLMEKYRYLEGVNPLKDKDKIGVGERILEVIWTPGHSPGHICIYERNLKILFTGDHILPDITPNIPLISWDTDPLKDYLSSLEKVKSFAIKLAYPGHNNPITNLTKRIDELEAHHEMRLKAILKLIGDRELSAYEIASRLEWDVDFPSWSMFPTIQRYFAIAETLSHLKYLYVMGKIERREMGGVYYYKA